MLRNIKISRNLAFLRFREAKNAIFPLINVKMPTTVGIFNIYEQEKNSCSTELSMKKFCNLGTRFPCSRINPQSVHDPYIRTKVRFKTKKTMLRPKINPAGT